jgi:tyrosine-protein kinase Etk/Wzc
MDRPGIKFRQDARKAISDSVSITTGKDGMITINANDKDPAFAAEMANAYVEELGNLLHQFAITEAKQRRVFLDGQLNSAKSNFRQVEQALKASGIDSSALKLTGAAVSEIDNLKGQITVQEIKLASMRGYLTDAAPNFKQTQTTLEALRIQLNRAAKAEPASKDANPISGDYIAKYREFKYYETLLAYFVGQYDIARIDESRDAQPIQVVVRAEPPELQNEPPKAQGALNATLRTGIALLLFVGIRQAINSAVKNPKTAAKLNRLSQTLTTALGWIPSKRV